MFQNEKVIETKSCKKCYNLFPVTDKDGEFYEKASPSFGGKKYLIPSPSFCPDCRQQRRMTFRNERNLYRRKCDATGQDIISMYSPDKAYTVYHQDYWWSDRWNPMDYGKDFDFNTSFFEQFSKLSLEMPKLSAVVLGNENSPYVNFVGNSKNVYMSGDVIDSEDLYFSNMIKKVSNGIDLFDIQNSSECYECVCSKGLAHCTHCYYSENCTNSKYLYNCNNVSDSLFCVNISNKRYCILNKEVSKEEFDKILLLLQHQEGTEYFKQFKELLMVSPRKCLRLQNVENSTGELLNDSKNALKCYHSDKLEDCKYISIGHTMSFCMDTTIHNPDCFLDYEAISGGALKYAISNSVCGYGHNMYYCWECFQSSNLFGCIGLRNKSYCILNKQYTKEEYEELVPRIIEHMIKTGEWGEFFPSSISPFGYNETVEQEYFPLTREEVLNPQSLRDSSFNKGANAFFLSSKEDTGKVGGFLHGLIFNWSDYEAPFPKVEKIIPASKLPDDITKIPDDILNWAIECEVTKKPFRIIKQELEFYRKHHLPIPHKHPDQRHLERMQLRNPRKLFTRHCDKCKKEIQTTYAPERPEIVYCEECYNKEVY